MKLSRPRQKAFRDGQKRYHDAKPMPPMPKDDDAFSKKGWLWCGWMIGRANDVQKIFYVLDLVGIRNTPEGDRLTKKLVAALDRKLGFTPIP